MNGLRCGAVFIFLIGLVCTSAACLRQKDINKIAGKCIGHSNSELPLGGMEVKEIRNAYGKPTEVRKENYDQLIYPYSKPLPKFDEQWIYRGSMIKTVLFIKGDKVVLAVKEWSDL